MFIDQATIVVRAGKGGDGIVSFRREKFIPKGGPDGGNGGRGGDVIIRADRHMTTLMDFRYRRIYRAPNGQAGMGANKTGKSGDDIIIRVPVGTVIRNAGTGATEADIVTPEQAIVIAHGGRGGKGNAMFATSVQQAPRKATKGDPGEERNLLLELKLLADVGLVGFPNAGKSTLISRISAARPKIAEYPFTTLIPHLGIVSYAEHKSFVVADMPGLIEGAHTGKGLGIRFLRHIERNSMLLFMIPADSKNIREEYEILVNELKMYNPELLDKKRMLAVSKSDMLDEELMNEIRKDLPDIPRVFISSLTGQGITTLKDMIWKELNF